MLTTVIDLDAAAPHPDSVKLTTDRKVRTENNKKLLVMVLADEILLRPDHRNGTPGRVVFTARSPATAERLKAIDAQIRNLLGVSKRQYHGLVRDDGVTMARRVDNTRYWDDKQRITKLWDYHVSTADAARIVLDVDCVKDYSDQYYVACNVYAIEVINIHPRDLAKDRE